MTPKLEEVMELADGVKTPSAGSLTAEPKSPAQRLEQALRKETLLIIKPASGQLRAQIFRTIGRPRV